MTPAFFFFPFFSLFSFLFTDSPTTAPTTTPHPTEPPESKSKRVHVYSEEISKFYFRMDTIQWDSLYLLPF